MHARWRTAAVASALTGALTLGTFAQVPAPAARTLELSFPAPGRVTLVASNVSVRDVLAEWSRQTGATFTHAERLPATPMVLQFDNLPEVQVMASLLRSAAGYMIAPLDPGPVVASRIKSVYIVPTSQGSTAQGTFNSTPRAPVAAPLVTPGLPGEQIPPANNPDPEPPTTGQPPAGRANTPGVIVPIVPVIGGSSGGRGSTPPPTPPPTPPTGSGGSGS